MRVSAAALTDVGLVRSQNEDAYLLWDLANRRPFDPAQPLQLEGEAACLLLVSDGMGGANSGDVASRTAIESMRDHATDGFHAARLGLGDQRPRRWLAGAVARSNQDLRERSRADPGLKGMGATLTAAAVFDGALVVAHVGDSRAYLLRGTRFRQLTMDHTHVQKLVSVGRISNEEAKTHERRNLLLQAMGTDDSVEVDQLDVSVAIGDRVLLCSDGLHGLVDDEEIARELGSSDAIADQCRALVERAKENGGHDNITVVIAHLQ